MSDKVTVADGRLWYQETVPGAYDIGLTEDILSQVKDQCWAIIPKVGNVQQGQPLFAIETNDELLSVLSPFSGRVVGVEFAAQNSPEKLTAGQRIISFDTNTRPRVAAPPPPPPERRAARPFAADNINWGEIPAAEQLLNPRDVIEMMRRQQREALDQQRQAAAGRRIAGAIAEPEPENDAGGDGLGPVDDGAW